MKWDRIGDQCLSNFEVTKMINARKDNLRDNYDLFKKSGLNCKMGLAKNTNLGKKWLHEKNAIFFKCHACRITIYLKTVCYDKHCKLY